MKIIVAVVVHNRFFNIRDWITIWKAAGLQDAELVVIHNYDGSEKIKMLCEDNGIRYVRRTTGGFDIGAFQDVCFERLAGFSNEWDYLLWCTDDVVPICRDFLSVFIRPLVEKHTELTCMQISDEIVRHVRTTGFCITKELSLLLAFPANPITTRRECLLFEHRGDRNTLYQQCLTLGIIPQQTPINIAHSTLYDKGFWSRSPKVIAERHLHDRMPEFKKFMRQYRHGLLTIAIPTYEMRGVGAFMLRELLESIKEQKTGYDYEILISDSSPDEAVRKLSDRYKELLPITYHRNLTRLGASENINNSLDLVTSEIVKVMCQDDRFCHISAIDRFVEALQDHQWAIANSVHMNAEGQVYSKQHTAYKHRDFSKNVTGMPSVAAWINCDLRFDERLRTICDMYFYHQLYKLYGAPAVITDFVVAQRYHNNSQSRNQVSRHNDEVNFLLQQNML